MAIINEQAKAEFLKYEQKLNKAVDHLKNELLTVRAGRANPQILNKVTVDYYGTPTPINQMANVNVPDARMIMIIPYDASTVKDISKAIMSANLGVSPTDDGKSIRLMFPQLTEERRKEITKQIKALGENSKVVLRNERRDVVEVMKKFKKDNIISEDEQSSSEKDIQKSLDKAVEIVDKLIKDKEAEILEV